MTSGTLTPTRRLLAVAVLVLTVLASGVMTRDADAAIRRPERRLARMVNKFRIEHNRDRLSLSARLSRVAEQNSASMARTGQIQHTGNNPCGGWWAEVAAFGSSVGDAFRNAKQSQTHRELLLRPQAERMGTGVRRDDQGFFWITIILCA